MADFTQYKLGKLAPKFEDRDLKLARYFTPQLPPPPPQCLWSPSVKSWPLHDNDKIGDCALVAHSHDLLCKTANSDGRDRAVVVPTAKVIQAYSAITGFDPRTGDNDNGTVMS